MIRLLLFLLLLTACTPAVVPVAPLPNIPAVAPGQPTAPLTTPAALWLPIHNGDCPSTHPLKANPDSMVYHRPDMDASYTRLTNPRVRCYRDTPAVEADGYRAARN